MNLKVRISIAWSKLRLSQISTPTELWSSDEGNHGWIIQWPRWPRVQVHRYRYWRMSTGILVWIQYIYLIDILYCYFCLWAVLDSYLVYIPPKKSHSTVELYWVDWHGSCCPKYGWSWMFSVLGIKLFQRVPIYETENMLVREHT